MFRRLRYVKNALGLIMAYRPEGKGPAAVTAMLVSATTGRTAFEGATATLQLAQGEYAEDITDADGDGCKEFAGQLAGSGSGSAPGDLVTYFANANSQSFASGSVVWCQDAARHLTARSGDRERCLAAGADEYLKKLFVWREFLVTIAAFRQRKNPFHSAEVGSPYGRRSPRAASRRRYQSSRLNSTFTACAAARMCAGLVEPMRGTMGAGCWSNHASATAVRLV